MLTLSRTLRGRILCGTALLAFALGTRAAHAQSAPTAAELVARRDFLSRAEQASTQNDHARAVELATRALTIQSTPSVRMFLAEEERAQQHLATALGHADQCAREAQAQAASVRNREFVLSRCTELQRELLPRVGRLTVRVPAELAEGLTVRVNGQPLASAFWNEPFPVDPGTVHVDAQRAGRSLVRDVTVASGRTEEFLLPTETLAASARGSATPAGPAVAPAGSGPLETPPPPARPRTVLPVGAFVVGGVGLAGLAFGLISIAPQTAAVSILQRDCRVVDPSTSICPASAEPTLATAQQWTLLANVGMIAGGAVLAGGTIWLLAGRRTETQPRVQATVVPSSQGLMLTVGGAL